MFVEGVGSFSKNHNYSISNALLCSILNTAVLFLTLAEFKDGQMSTCCQY